MFRYHLLGLLRNGTDHGYGLAKEYRRRGDLEIWRIQPYERTITVWRRQPNGSYDEVTYTEGVLSPASLPGVTIDLSELFDSP